MEFVKEHNDVPAVVLYQETSGDHIWWLSDELMEYPKVYLASMGNKEPIADQAVIRSDSLIVYAADSEDSDACLQGLLGTNWKTCQLVAQKGRGVWKLYYLTR